MLNLSKPFSVFFSRSNLLKFLLPILYFVILILVVAHARNVQAARGQRLTPLHVNLMEQTVFVRHGFEQAQLERMQGINHDSWSEHFQELVRWETRPLWIRDAPLQGLPKASYFTPRRGAVEEFTIIIPFEIGPQAMAYLEDGKIVPGFFFASLGENWEVYLNSILVRSEMYLDENGQIISHRWWRNVYFPIDESLITLGTNILALRIVGDPTLGSTGLQTRTYYLDDFRLIRNSQGGFFQLILAGIIGFNGVYYLLQFLQVRKKQELFYLYFAVFSIMLCVYAIMRSIMIDFIIPNSAIARGLGFVSLAYSVVFFCMFVEAIGKGKLTLVTKIYLAFCTALIFLQIFIFRHYGEEATRFLNVTILLYCTYIVFYDVFYFYFFDKSGPRIRSGKEANALMVSLIAGVLAIYVSGIFEIVDMLFLFNHVNLFIPAVFMVQIGMAFTLSNRFRTMYNQLDNTVKERNELLERIETMLSHTAVVPKSLAKGSLSLDIISGRAIVDNNDLLLAPKEFACLLVFAQNEDEVMSTEAIYENIWKQPLEGNLNTLKTTISNLRKKIEPSGYTISAIRGKGYMFERK
jgi:hypothetical protein